LSDNNLQEADPKSAPLLSVRNLAVEFKTEEATFPAVRGISFDIQPGSCLGIVGESGSGKSVTSLAILGLVPQPPGRVLSGSINFRGRDLLKLSKSEIRSVRGGQRALIFQEPMTSLNPALTIGDQIGEAVQTHEHVSRRLARARTLELLREVQIPSPERRIDEHPHKLSGGMRQRVMIALALAGSPSLLIADEPTTALDVTIQAQVLDLLRRLQHERGMSILLISHNLGVIAELADEVAVMYAGQIVECAPAKTIFRQPEHPYTIGLLGAVPKLTPDGSRLVAIEGMVPDLRNLPAGCVFLPRCPFSTSTCEQQAPAFRPLMPGHEVACSNAPIM
jgi:oligopeptide/dipeptide ABC transporter ATP-binding protein